jgi:hypothetical protein
MRLLPFLSIAGETFLHILDQLLCLIGWLIEYSLEQSCSCSHILKRVALQSSKITAAERVSSAAAKRMHFFRKVLKGVI